MPKTRERNKEDDKKNKTRRSKKRGEKRRQLNEQIRRNRKAGPEDGRSEGAAWGNTPERAAAASSRETEADPNLLRFGGSAAGESAPPAEFKLSARTTHLEGKAARPAAISGTRAAKGKGGQRRWWLPW